MYYNTHNIQVKPQATILATHQHGHVYHVNKEQTPLQRLKYHCYGIYIHTVSSCYLHNTSLFLKPFFLSLVVIHEDFSVSVVSFGKMQLILSHFVVLYNT